MYFDNFSYEISPQGHDYYISIHYKVENSAFPLRISLVIPMLKMTFLHVMISRFRLTHLISFAQ